MIKIEIPGIEEFEDELKKDRNFLDRDIVRVVIKRSPVHSMVNAYHYMVELTAVIDVYGKVKILETAIYCGETWKDNNGKIISGDGEEKADQKLKEIMQRFIDLGFDVRFGRFTVTT